jgi:hypothetical protein
MAEPTLYERLGGIFAIAAVVDHFSDQLLKNPKVVEANPELNEWHTAKYPGRLPGLKRISWNWLRFISHSSSPQYRRNENNNADSWRTRAIPWRAASVISLIVSRQRLASSTSFRLAHSPSTGSRSWA